MLSHRLNRKGETIPSVKEPYVYHGSGYDYSTRHPHGDRTLACAYGCDEDSVGRMDDAEFAEYNREQRRRAATVLARETNLGRDNTTAAILRQSKSQEDFNLFLTQNNKWAVGDHVSYSGIPEGSPNLSIGSCGIILATERLLDKVVYKSMEGEFCPFLVLGLHPYKWIQDHPDEKPSGWLEKFHARWSSCRYHRHLSTHENSKLFKDNVQLSDYIGQAKEALKAGLVEISGGN